MALIISGLRGGGAERICVTLANALAERGHQVEVVVLNMDDAVRQKELRDDVNIVDLRVKHARQSMLPLVRYVKRSCPTHILSFNRQISVVLVLIRKINRFGFRLVSRNVTYLSAAERAKTGFWHAVVVRRLVKRWYCQSDLIIAQSKAMKSDLVSHLSIPSELVSVIYNPLPAWVSAREVENTVASDEEFGERYILCVGRLDPVKSYHYAIEAFASICHSYEGMRLKFVGAGPSEKPLRELAVKLGISRRVDFEGYREDIEGYYRQASLTLLTSLYEGFPNVLVESIASGTPIVSFDCPSGPDEIVIQGVNGYLVPHQNQAKLAHYLSVCLDRTWDAASVSATSERFSARKIVDEYECALDL